MPRFLKLAHKHFTRKSFSNILGMHSALYVENNNTDTGSGIEPVEFVYTVPKRMCRSVKDLNDKEGKRTNLFTIGPIIAVMDELSTYGFMLKDKNKRGGVSVYLSARMHQHPKPGDELIVSTQVTKIGKSLGFCDINVFSKDDCGVTTDKNPSVGGNRIHYATGYHIKFLPAGMLWNILTNRHVREFLLPHLEGINPDMGNGDPANKSLLTRVISYVINDKNETTKLKEGESMPERDDVIVAADELGSLYDKLKLRLTHISNTDGGGCCDASDNDMKSNKMQGSASYEFKVRREYSNILGNLHGGLVAINAEESVLRSDNSNDVLINEMNVKYLSPMQGDICFNTEPIPMKLDHISTEYPYTESPRVAKGTVTKGNKRKGVVDTCAQFECILSDSWI